MQLDNPAPRLAAIIASLPDNKRAPVLPRLARVERALAGRYRGDTDLLDAILRVLSSPHPKAERLRQLIKEIANG